ncbi:MAG TPA: hypothetical protein PKE54_03750, partial [Candidatus Obscuribacter sp.]|nr:hypothetical protein [Candidatus Obscuribacter sp.]
VNKASDRYAYHDKSNKFRRGPNIFTICLNIPKDKRSKREQLQIPDIAALSSGMANSGGKNSVPK